MCQKQDNGSLKVYSNGIGLSILHPVDRIKDEKIVSPNDSSLLYNSHYIVYTLSYHSMIILTSLFVFIIWSPFHSN